MAQPILSVVLPAHNAEAHLRAAIDSVLEQSFKDFELIVINDGSTDHTGEILGAFNDPRIRLILHGSNKGLIEALNAGIQTSTGRYIARMDADDISEPTRFQRQIEYLEMHPEIGVLGSAIKVINQWDRVLATVLMPSTAIDIEWAMPLVCPLAHPSVMMRSDIVKHAGGYPAGAVHVEDYELWWRLSRNTRITNLSIPLLRLRKHCGSVTSTQRHTHLNSAAAVSKAEIDSWFDESVPIRSVRCLRSWGASDPECALSATRLLSRLLVRLCSKYPPASVRTARRDAAIRTLYLSRLVAGRARIRILRDVLDMDPFALLGLARKTIHRLIPGVSRSLIG